VVEEEKGYKMFYTGCMRRSQAIGLAVKNDKELFPPEGTPNERGDFKGYGAHHYYYNDVIAMRTRWNGPV